MSGAVIELQGVSKHYKLYSNNVARLKELIYPFNRIYHQKHTVLEDINLTLQQGEVLGVVGRNGVGKSTLLRIISKLIRPSQGEVKVDGKISAILELGGGLNGQFTGVQNIFFLGALQGFSREQVKQRISDIIAFADINDHINQPVKNYSSGMKARLNFAIATHIEPEILILDEVLAVGDELFRRKCYAKMEEFFNAGKTIVYVSHDANSIMELCTRAIFLESSRIALDADPKTVIAYYQKYLYADDKKREAIRNEIVHLKNTKLNSKKKNRECEHVSFKSTLNNDYYLSQLKPETTLEYQNFPVEFIELEVLSTTGQKRNVLKTGVKYQIYSKIKFGIEVSKVGFSFAIKNEKGMDLSTYKTLKHQLVNAKSGDVLEVTWDFKNWLMPGIYYLNIGARSYPDNKESFVLNRVVDAYVFKVEALEPTNSGGIFTLGQTMRVTRVVK